MLNNGEEYKFMESKWDMDSNIIKDLRFSVSKMKNMKLPKRPRRIECAEETYSMISEKIKSRNDKYGDLIFPWGNPFDIIFIQTDFSEWREEDFQKGYRVVY